MSSRPAPLGRCRAFQKVMFRVGKTMVCAERSIWRTRNGRFQCVFRVDGTQFSKVGWFGWVIGSPGLPPGLGSDFKYFVSGGSAGVGSAIALEATGICSPSYGQSLFKGTLSLIYIYIYIYIYIGLYRAPPPPKRYTDLYIILQYGQI